MEGPILNHAPGGRRLWLIAGTGEGPPLASVLLARGWRMKVSVVTPPAALAYPSHPRLEVEVGAIGADAGGDPEAGVARELERARTAGDPYAWVVDASHPFAARITAALATVCDREDQPLLRLRRPSPPLGDVELLPDLSALEGRIAAGERLLLAIGARHLAEAVRRTPAAVHHARVLPWPGALRQAMAAGLSPAHVACLRPGAAAAVEAALCRRWRIQTVLCRRSGGPTERHWRAVGARLGLRLMLLEPPPEPAAVRALPLGALPDALEGKAEPGGSQSRWGTPLSGPS